MAAPCAHSMPMAMPRMFDSVVQQVIKKIPSYMSPRRAVLQLVFDLAKNHGEEKAHVVVFSRGEEAEGHSCSCDAEALLPRVDVSVTEGMSEHEGGRSCGCLYGRLGGVLLVCCMIRNHA